MAYLPKIIFVVIAWVIILPTLFREVSSQETRITSPNNGRQSCSEDHNCLRTSGCLIPRAQNPISLTGLLTPSREHVTGLVEEFQIRLHDLTNMVLEAREDWDSSLLYLRVPEIGLGDLYPTVANSTDLALALPGTRFRVLRELRWWMTSVESHIQLLRYTGLAHTASNLDRKTAHLSRELSLLLSLFGVHSVDLPIESICVQTSSALTDSITRRATFVSMALRDIHRALERMSLIFRRCEVLEPCGRSGEEPCEPHHGRRRHPRLNCHGGNTSVFYPQVPSDIVFLYHHSHFLLE